MFRFRSLLEDPRVVLRTTANPLAAAGSQTAFSGRIRYPRNLLRWSFELVLITVVGALGYQMWRSRQSQPTPTVAPQAITEKTAALVQSPAEQTIVLDISEIEGDERLTVYDLVPRKHHHHY